MTRRKPGAVPRSPGGVPRRFMGFKPSAAARDWVVAQAKVETGGNVSAMLRTLLNEAKARREARAGRGPCPTCKG